MNKIEEDEVEEEEPIQIIIENVPDIDLSEPDVEYDEEFEE